MALLSGPGRNICLIYVYTHVPLFLSVRVDSLHSTSPLIAKTDKIKAFFLTKDFFFSQKRLQKELLALQNDPPPGMTLNEKSVQNTITQ